MDNNDNFKNNIQSVDERCEILNKSETGTVRCYYKRCKSGDLIPGNKAHFDKLPNAAVDMGCIRNGKKMYMCLDCFRNYRDNR